MTSGFFSGDVLKGLAARVLFFLSIALLPIGVIAIAQTREIAEQNETNNNLSLLAMTEQASIAERAILQEAFGAADALASIVTLHMDNSEECSEFFRAYRDITDIYGVVGFIPTDGMMTCSSSDEPFDFSGDPMFERSLANPVRAAVSERIGAITGQTVTLVSSPVFVKDVLQGFIAISIPSVAFDAIEEPDLPYDAITIFSFNTESEILLADTGLDVAQSELPSNVAVSLFTGTKGSVFKALNQDQVERIYAVQPIVGDAAYAMSVWPVDAPFLDPDITAKLGSLLPILMWAASLIVAFWALNRLALRHIRKLGRQMRRFALNRDLPRVTLGSSVPTELRDMEAAFIGMGESILRDEAQLEDSLREKNILLKEVHHRVKNNLQLISSIMNMQIRQAKTVESSQVLRRLQERILSLATVHKNLYQNDNLVKVDAPSLLAEAVEQIVVVGLEASNNVQVIQSYDKILLEADDAAPLTLLVSEAITNAIKNVPKNKPKPSYIRVSLIKDSDTRARLTVTNTTGDDVDVPAGTGLGDRLIHAFARQLNGDIEVEKGGDFYRMTLDFPLPQSSKPTNDY